VLHPNNNQKPFGLSQNAYASYLTASSAAKCKIETSVCLNDGNILATSIGCKAGWVAVGVAKQKCGVSCPLQQPNTPVLIESK
jgi:hypothetical protein